MRIVAIGFVVLLLMSCQRSALSKEELQAYLQDHDHGLTGEVTTSSGMLASAMYWPSSLLFGEEEDPAKGQLHFILKLSHEGQGLALYYASRPAYQKKVISYLSYQVQEDVVIRGAEGKSYPALGVHYDPSYDAYGQTRLLITFDKAVLEEPTFELCLNVPWLTSSMINFTFSSKAIRATPSLKS